MPRVLCAPFYKGMVHAEDADSLALITRRDPLTDTEISYQKYLELLEKSRADHPELVQNIARGSAAAVQALVEHADNEEPMLVSVEGCLQMVGGRPMTGGKIMESIWQNVVPPELMQWSGSMHIQEVSRCTVEEARLICAIPDSKAIFGVTHAYHQTRTERILREEAGDKVTNVQTPEMIVNRLGKTQPIERFLHALVKASEPSPAFVSREQRHEIIHHPLHTFSRTGEILTGGKFNFEMWLANRMRK